MHAYWQAIRAGKMRGDDVAFCCRYFIKLGGDPFVMNLASNFPSLVAA